MKNLWALRQQHPDTDPLNEQKAVSLWLTQLCMPWKNTSDWSAKKEQYGGRIMEIHQRFGTYQPCVPCDALFTDLGDLEGGWFSVSTLHRGTASSAVVLPIVPQLFVLALDRRVLMIHCLGCPTPCGESFNPSKKTWKSQAQVEIQDASIVLSMGANAVIVVLYPRISFVLSQSVRLWLHFWILDRFERNHLSTCTTKGYQLGHCWFPLKWDPVNSTLILNSPKIGYGIMAWYGTK